jgi:hypothetical protein
VNEYSPRGGEGAGDGRRLFFRRIRSLLWRGVAKISGSILIGIDTNGLGEVHEFSKHVGVRSSSGGRY